MIDTASDPLSQQVGRALQQIAASTTLDVLELQRVSLLGKTGLITRVIERVDQAEAELFLSNWKVMGGVSRSVSHFVGPALPSADSAPDTLPVEEIE